MSLSYSIQVCCYAPNSCALTFIDIEKFEFNEFGCSSEGSNTVLMRMRSLQSDMNGNRRCYRCLLVICDLETKEVRVKEHTTRHSLLLEIDLPSRLRAMELLP
jgi:hypothetical protein